MLKGLWLIGPLLMTAVMCGCNTQMYNPNYWHSSFVAGLQKNVGKHFESVRSGDTGGWAWDRDLVSRTELPNGHLSIKYRYQGTCRYSFEVDPKTDFIVAASWEGEERHCAIVP